MTKDEEKRPAKPSKRPEKKPAPKPPPPKPAPPAERTESFKTGLGHHYTVVLRKIGKEEVVVTTWPEGVALRTLASTFGLQPERAFYRGVLAYAVNKEARRSLYEADRLADNPEKPGDGRVILFLKEWGKHDRYWAFKPAENQSPSVALPYSLEFAKVLEGLARERERQAVVAKMRDVTDAVYKKMRKIDEKLKEIDKLIGFVSDLSSAALKEIALLEAAHVVLRAARTSPDGKFNEHDDAWLGHEVAPALVALKEKCYALMVHDSVAYEESGRLWRKEIDDLARQVHVLFADPQLREDIGFVYRHPDHVDHNLWRHLPLYLQHLTDTMLRTSWADRYIADYLDPMIDEFARAAKIAPGVSAPKLAGFDAALMKEIPPPGNKGPLQAMAYYSTLFGYAAGNLPGPASLSVLLHRSAAPKLMEAALKLRGRSGAVGAVAARQYRFLVATADLNAAEQKLLASTINDLDPKKARSIEWDSKYMNSPAWGAAIAVVSIITLIAAIQDDEASTIKRWTAIVSSSVGVTMGAATFLNYTKLYEKGFIGGIGKAAGVLASVLTAYSGFAAYREARSKGDTFGSYSGLGSGIGGTASVIGFIMSSGIVVSSTGIGAPIGLALELIGLAMLVVTTIADYIVGQRTTKTEAMLKGLIETFGRTYLDEKRQHLSEFWMARQKSKELDRLYKELWKFIDQSWYMDVANINKAHAPQLFDVGFSVEQVAAFTNQSKIDAWVQLMKADRDPGPWKS